jgi:hypothetical protein
MWSGDIHKSLGKYSDLGTRINATWSLQILWTRGGTSNIFVPEDTLMVWPRSKDGRFSYPKKSKGSLFRGRCSVRRPWRRWQGFFFRVRYICCRYGRRGDNEEERRLEEENWWNMARKPAEVPKKKVKEKKKVQCKQCSPMRLILLI